MIVPSLVVPAGRKTTDCNVAFCAKCHKIFYTRNFHFLSQKASAFYSDKKYLHLTQKGLPASAANVLNKKVYKCKKTCSLFCRSVNYECKKFYDIDPSDDMISLVKVLKFSDGDFPVQM